MKVGNDAITDYFILKNTKVCWIRAIWLVIGDNAFV